MKSNLNFSKLSRESMKTMLKKICELLEIKYDQLRGLNGLEITSLNKITNINYLEAATNVN